MNRRTLLAQLYPAYLFVAILSVVAMAWFITATCRAFFVERVESDLQQLVTVLAAKLPDDLHAACGDFHSNAEIALSVLDSDGSLVCQTPQAPKGIPVVTAATPVTRNGQTVAFVRAALPMSQVDSSLSEIRKQVLLAGIAVVALASIVTWLLARQVTKPLAEMLIGLKEFAQGHFTHRLPIADSVELAELAEAINDMASKLDERITTIIQQRNEQEAVLSSMGEGVIAVDREERIIRMNRSAGELFGVETTDVSGKPVEEVVRNFQLRRFVEEILQRSAAVEQDVTLRLPDERILRLHGSVLRDADGAGMGAVVVIDDLTSLRRLEGMRRNFVANVSHELRTPITSMKGFVETLLDGAIDNKDDARRFIEIIGRHTERLREIIDNLMKLARLEQDSELRQLERDDFSVRNTFRVVEDLCGRQAAERGIGLNFQAPENLRVNANIGLLEQAVVNLVDNALKYTERGKQVWISVEQTDDDWLFRVRDEGSGIAKEHLDRIFERFYRVDKGRSRKEGGTGLGLAIVKHVAIAHGGEVGVESEVGVGSMFTLRIPRHPSANSQTATSAQVNA